MRLNQNHDAITEPVGSSVDLVCDASVDFTQCFFKSPQGNTLPALKGVVHEGGRIKANVEGRKCGITITDIKDKDNGKWECQIGTVGNNGEYHQTTGDFMVTVAVAPERVAMNVNGKESAEGKIIVSKKEDNKKLELECVTYGVRPRPSFKWMIGNTAVDGMKENTEDIDDSGKGTYGQKLEYFAIPKHNGQKLKCIVTHDAYTEQDIRAGKNTVEKTIEVLFKPEEKPSGVQQYYNLKENGKNTIKFKFQANPGPTSGQWKVHGDDGKTVITVAVGAEDLKRTMESTQFEASKVSNW